MNVDDNGRDPLNGRYKTSTEPMRSPPDNSQTHAQNDNDSPKSGDGGDGGDVFYKVIICLPLLQLAWQIWKLGIGPSG